MEAGTLSLIMVDGAKLTPLEMRALMNEMLGELWVASVIALTDHLGEELSIRYMRPRMKVNMHEGWHYWKERLKLDDDPLSILAYLMHIGSRAGGLVSKAEMSEWGVALTVYECTVGRPDREIFCKLHALAFDCLCEAMDPEYVDRHVKWLTRGDPVCQHLAIRRTLSSDKWFDSGGVIMLLTEPSVSMEQLLEVGSWHVSSQWMIVVQALVDAVGSELALSILRPEMNKRGRAAGRRLLCILNIDQDTKGALENVVAFLHELMQQPTEGRLTKDGYEERVASCPFEDASDEVHVLFDAYIEGVCQAVEPGCVLTVERSALERGVCKWRLERSRHALPGP